MNHYNNEIEQSVILDKLNLDKEDYFLVTAHRAENVDYEDRLIEIMKGINMVAETYQKRIICSLHPRTKSRIELSHKLEVHPLIEFHEPFGFFDFVKLEKMLFVC